MVTPDEAVIVIIGWSLFNTFVLGPAMVERRIIARAGLLVRALFDGLAAMMMDPRERAALEALLAELTKNLKSAMMGGLKAPSGQEMLRMAIAQRIMGGAPPGQGAPEGAPVGPPAGLEVPHKRRFFRDR